MFNDKAIGYLFISKKREKWRHVVVFTWCAEKPHTRQTRRD